MGANPNLFGGTLNVSVGSFDSLGHDRPTAQIGTSDHQPPLNHLPGEAATRDAVSCVPRPYSSVGRATDF